MKANLGGDKHIVFLFYKGIGNMFLFENAYWSQAGTCKQMKWPWIG